MRRSTSRSTTLVAVVARAGARRGAASPRSRRSSTAIAADARLEADREALDVRRPADLLDVGAARPARATPSARCRSCADTRSSAARAASPACRAAWSRSCGSSSAQHRHRLLRPTRSSSAVMSAENGVWPPSCVDRQAAVDPDPGRVVDGAEVQDRRGRRRASSSKSRSYQQHAVKAAVADAARLRLRRERHLDRAGPSRAISRRMLRTRRSSSKRKRQGPSSDVQRSRCSCGLGWAGSESVTGRSPVAIRSILGAATSAPRRPLDVAGIFARTRAGSDQPADATLRSAIASSSGSHRRAASARLAFAEALCGDARGPGDAERSGAAPPARPRASGGSSRRRRPRSARATRRCIRASRSRRLRGDSPRPRRQAATKSSALARDRDDVAEHRLDVVDRRRHDRLAGGHVLERLGRADEARSTRSARTASGRRPSRRRAAAAARRAAGRASGGSARRGSAAGSILTTGPTMTTCQRGSASARRRRGRGRAARR